MSGELVHSALFSKRGSGWRKCIGSAGEGLRFSGCWNGRSSPKKNCANLHPKAHKRTGARPEKWALDDEDHAVRPRPLGLARPQNADEALVMGERSVQREGTAVSCWRRTKRRHFGRDTRRTRARRGGSADVRQALTTSHGVRDGPPRIIITFSWSFHVQELVRLVSLPRYSSSARKVWLVGTSAHRSGDSSQHPN